ncbi:SGNH/GDSL hydrolase family protein [Mycoplasma sp. 'Moose RK']|uniref:SGNH/GDSL hydrolase family protein n=1 Tax=Mycoplasma sp. 'Moose RK' TaxID=2780095 RepID=UPI0018C34329|nr:SGNH/GDSL hydrolase family protein [Mycoplasma sp. 'Moose RK']MBG0730844.1 SGNH/GDSL hydrolase family protein [Mycoplasma sp. 'Moose RK']
MKNSRKPVFSNAFKLLFGITTLAATAVTAAAISLKNRRNLQKNSTIVNYSIAENQPILKEINYLALGDSISAGFNWDYSFDFRGFLDDNSQVKGLSYPAFFADFVQKIKPGALKSFDNLALSWTTIADWLYLLEPTNPQFKNFSKGHLNFSHQLDKLTNSPYGKQISEVFGDFSGENFPLLRAKIAKANLLTISLGANDLMSALDFGALFLPGQNIATKNEAKFQFLQKIETAFLQIERNLQTLVTKIRQINKNLKIVFLGYNTLSSISIKFLEKMFENELGLEENYAGSLIKRLNKLLQRLAKNGKFNFVDLFNDKLWQEKSNNFAKNEFDIHPSPKGYKKMAQDLIFKLALKKDPDFESEISEKLTWNKEYLQKDENSYQRILDLGTNEEILKKLTINDSISDFVSQDSEIEKISIAGISPNSGPQVAILAAVGDGVNFGVILQRFLQSNSQIKSHFADLLGDFFAKLGKNNTSFFQVLQKILQSNFFLDIIEKLQNYIKDVVTKEEWKKATFSSLINFIFSNFNEKNLVSLFKETINSDFVSQNQIKIKELIFAAIFGENSIQNLLINEFIKISPEYQDDLKVIFKFDSVRQLFTKVINEFIINSADYLPAKSFQDIIRIFLSNSENYQNIVKFAKDFSSETLKHPESVQLLVKIINQYFSFGIKKEEQKVIGNLFLSIGDIVIRTETWNKLTKNVAENFLNAIKKTDFSTTTEKVSEIFTKKIEESYTDFFKKPSHILTLLQEILRFDLNKNQINSIKNLAKKFYPLVAKIRLEDFISPTKPNYGSFLIFFDSIKDFLSTNSFRVLDDLVMAAIEDFLVENKHLYQQVDSLNRFGFNFAANNLAKLREKVYDFLAKNVKSEKFLESISNSFGKLLDSHGLSQQSIDTFVKLIKLIFQDFVEKYEVQKGKQTVFSGNLIFDFVESVIKNFARFTKENSEKYNQLKSKLEAAKKAKNQTEIDAISTEIATVDAELNLSNFLNFFLENFLTTKQIFELMRGLADLKIEPIVTVNDLVLFFKELLGKDFLEKQLVNKLAESTIFGQEKVKNSLFRLLENFFESSVVEELLAKFINYIFDKKNFEKATDFTTFGNNFLNENKALIEKIFSLFLGDSATWISLREFLLNLLEANKINLSSENKEIILTLIRDIFTKLRNATIATNQGQKTDAPLIMQSVLKIITDSITPNSTSKKSIYETLIDNLSVDIANLYYGDKGNSENKGANTQNIGKLFAAIAQTEAVKTQIDTGLSKLPQEYSQDLKPIVDAFLKSEALEQLVNSYFSLLAKAKIHQAIDSVSLIKTLFEKQYFTKIVGDFILEVGKIPDLEKNFASLFGKIFKTKFETKEIQSLFELIKEIITDNLTNFYKNEPEDLSKIIAIPVNVGATEAITLVEKKPNYTKENALISKFVKIIGKLISSGFSSESVSEILEKELGNEEFIVSLFKQIGQIFDKLDHSEKSGLWILIDKIFKSESLIAKIKQLNFGKISEFSLFKNLNEIDKSRIDLQLKDLLTKFLSLPANKVLIIRFFESINQNSEKFTSIKTFSGILKTFLETNSSNTTNSDQNHNNSNFIKSYLWYLLDFLLKDKNFSEIIAKVIASYLKLNLEKIDKVSNPTEVITKFLKEFISLGFENPLVSTILDQVVNALKTASFDNNFFTEIFNKINLENILNLDLVIKLEPLVDSNAKKNEETAQNFSVDTRNLEVPKNNKISIAAFADFFDLVFLVSPKWDKNKTREMSPILEKLNNIHYTGISFSDLFSSGKKDPQLEAISKLFFKIYNSEPTNKITKDNFKTTAKGRVLYRFLLILLFFAYESRVKHSFLRGTAFYNNSFLKSSSASEIIFTALKNAKTSSDSNDNYAKFIDELKGNPIKSERWWGTNWYDNNDVKLDDMLTMIYYNENDNRFFKETNQQKLRDQILEQIRDGTYPENYEKPK